MQISRHWRMNAQRYRLEGVRSNTTSNQARAQHETAQSQHEHTITSARRARAIAAR